MDNNSFPARFHDGCQHGSSGDEFLQHMLNSATVIPKRTVHLPPEGSLSQPKRAELAAHNPVAFVIENKKLLNDMLNLLIGLQHEGREFCFEDREAQFAKRDFTSTPRGYSGMPLISLVSPRTTQEVTFIGISPQWEGSAAAPCRSSPI